MPRTGNEVGAAFRTAGVPPANGSAGPILLLLAGAGGVLCFLGFLGFGLWPLSLLCFAPLWQALENTRARRIGFAALLGYTFGIVAYAGGFHWMWRLVDAFLGGNVVLGGGLLFLDASWFGLRLALYSAAYTVARQHGWPVALAGVAPLIALEWLYPMLFPVFLGHALAGSLVVVQLADLGGSLLLTVLLLLLNAAFFEAWRWMRGRRSRPLGTWMLAGAAVALTWTYGYLRIGQIEAAMASAPSLRIGIVQGNLGLFEKGTRASLDHHKYLEQTRELLADGVPDLVVWPETVYSRGLARPLPLSGRLIREELEVPLLFGAASVSGETGQRRKYNSALLIGADGVIRDAYDKNLLIPFTEYVPFAGLGGAWLAEFAGTSAFTAADNAPALRFGAWRISTPICYEVVRPAFVRGMMLQGHPHLIATLANDSWFGDSQEAELHLAMARMRAVEHRRSLVRATNSGISAVVDPLGREIARTGLLTRENLRATVPLLEIESPYTAWGDWPGWIALAVTLAMLAVTRRGV